MDFTYSISYLYLPGSIQRGPVLPLAEFAGACSPGQSADSNPTALVCPIYPVEAQHITRLYAY